MVIYLSIISIVYTHTLLPKKSTLVGRFRKIILNTELFFDTLLNTEPNTEFSFGILIKDKDSFRLRVFLVIFTWFIIIIILALKIDPDAFSS